MPREGILVTHFIVRSDVGRAWRFYADVLWMTRSTPGRDGGGSWRIRETSSWVRAGEPGASGLPMSTCSTCPAGCARRAAGHRRRPYLVPRLRRPVHRPRNRPQGDGYRAGRRDPPGRHRRPRHPRPGPDRRTRKMELVAASMGTPAAANPGPPGGSRTRHPLTGLVRCREPRPAQTINVTAGAATAAGLGRTSRPLRETRATRHHAFRACMPHDASAGTVIAPRTPRRPGGVAGQFAPFPQADA